MSDKKKPAMTDPDCERDLAERLGMRIQRDNSCIGFLDMYGNGGVGFTPCQSKHVEKLLDLCLELLSSRRWVKIEPSNPETLPEDGQNVWVFLPATEGIEPRIFSKKYPVWQPGAKVKATDVFGAMYTGGYNLIEMVSHWTPYYIPPPPEKGATDVTD